MIFHTNRMSWGLSPRRHHSVWAALHTVCSHALSSTVCDRQLTRSNQGVHEEAERGWWDFHCLTVVSTEQTHWAHQIWNTSCCLSIVDVLTFVSMSVHLYRSCWMFPWPTFRHLVLKYAPELEAKISLTSLHTHAWLLGQLNCVFASFMKRN